VLTKDFAVRAWLRRSELSWGEHMRHVERVSAPVLLEIRVARAKLTDSARFRSSWRANLSDVHAGRESGRACGQTGFDSGESIGYSLGGLSGSATPQTSPASSISTSWDNLASRAIAAKLRLIPYTETLSLR
jgi:hypothetical protein